MFASEFLKGFKFLVGGGGGGANLLVGEGDESYGILVTTI